MKKIREESLNWNGGVIGDIIQTDTTALNPVISPEAEVGQIHLNVVIVLSSLKNSTDTKSGFVGAKVLNRKHAFSYPQPYSYDMWQSRSIHLYHSFQEMWLKRSHINISNNICMHL